MSEPLGEGELKELVPEALVQADFHRRLGSSLLGTLTASRVFNAKPLATTLFASAVGLHGHVDHLRVSPSCMRSTPP